MCITFEMYLVFIISNCNLTAYNLLVQIVRGNKEPLFDRVHVHEQGRERQEQYIFFHFLFISNCNLYAYNL